MRAQPKPWRLQEEAQGKSCLVVEKRAEKVAAEYVRKAQRTDQTVPAPLLQRGGAWGVLLLGKGAGSQI